MTVIKMIIVIIKNSLHALITHDGNWQRPTKVTFDPDWTFRASSNDEEASISKEVETLT